MPRIPEPITLRRIDPITGKMVDWVIRPRDFNPIEINLGLSLGTLEIDARTRAFLIGVGFYFDNEIDDPVYH